MSNYISNSMKVQDVIKHVQRQFGDEAGIQVVSDDIIRWINAGQSEIFRKAEPLKGQVAADIVAGQATYALPTENIMRIQSVLVNNLPVPQRSTQEVEEYILDQDPNMTGTGQPALWSEWGGNITFYPVPEITVVGGLLLRFIQGPTNVVAPTDLLSIPDAFYNRLVEYVLQQAYEMDENFPASDAKAAQFAQNLEQQTGKDQVMSNTYPTILVLDEDM